jgi:hypothetical protein
MPAQEPLPRQKPLYRILLDPATCKIPMVDPHAPVERFEKLSPIVLELFES